MISKHHGGKIMIQFEGLGHINIVVDDIHEAANYYENLFGAVKRKILPHFKNIGFAKSAGFLKNPELVDVSIMVMEIPDARVFFELFQYHHPKGSQTIKRAETNDLGGVRHVCFNVKNIDAAFNSIKDKEIKMINASPEYKPFKIDSIGVDNFNFFDPTLEKNLEAKQKVCEMIGHIRYFYFIDKYGVQWEFEECPKIA